MISSSYRSPQKFKDCLVVGLGMILGLILIVFIVYKVLDKPNYIILQISSPLSYLPHGDWIQTEYITQIWSDETSKFYIWRRETDAYSKSRDPSHGFESWNSVISYFDTRLAKYGWVFYEYNHYDPCKSFLAESEFLPRGLNGYVVYRRSTADKFAADEPTICLAVWPVSNEGQIERFHIVFLTANPSTYTRWRGELE